MLCALICKPPCARPTRMITSPENQNIGTMRRTRDFSSFQVSWLAGMPSLSSQR